MTAMTWVFLAACAGDGAKVAVPPPPVKPVVQPVKPVVQVVTRVDRKATVEGLKHAGIDVDGIEKLVSGLIDRVVADAQQGRVPDEAALRGELQQPGAPVDGVHVQVVEGNQALEEFAKRFPEMKTQVDEMVRQARDVHCSKASDAKSSKSSANHAAKSSPKRAVPARLGPPNGRLPPLGPRLPKAVRPKFESLEPGAAR